jgi:hypothetical protein
MERTFLTFITFCAVAYASSSFAGTDMKEIVQPDEEVYQGRIVPETHHSFSLGLNLGFSGMGGGGYYSPAINYPMGVGGFYGGGGYGSGGYCGGYGYPGAGGGVGGYPGIGYPGGYGGAYASGPGVYGPGMPMMPAMPAVPPPPQVIPPHMQMPGLGWGPGYGSYPGPGYGSTCGGPCGSSGYIPQPAYPVAGGPMMGGGVGYGGGIGFGAGLSIINGNQFNGSGEYYNSLAQAAGLTTTTVYPLAYPAQPFQVQQLPTGPAGVSNDWLRPTH